MTSGKEPVYRAVAQRRQSRASEQRQKEEQAASEQRQQEEEAASEQRQRDEQAEKDDAELRLKLFGEYKNEQQTRERANSDKYDNTILTYSTGAFGLSLTFIKDVVPLDTAHFVLMLKISWVLFVGAMTLMLLSFPIAQEVNRESVDFAYQYFVEKDEDFRNKESKKSKALNWLNRFAGAAFFCGILLTFIFVCLNVQEKSTMTDKSSKTTITTTTTKTVTTYAADATISANMTKMPMVKVQGGTPAAKMQAVNTTTPAPAPASSIPPSKTSK
jgi:hypothetical protein